ncbi:hypothetical protein BsWGS_24811 [Bradybaena similaris]
MPRNTSSQNTFLDTIATRFDGIHSNFVLGNAQAHGWPIVYCSDGFCELTGFCRAHVMAKGSCCKFLYGPETSDVEIAKIMEALEDKNELKTELQLYRKNGTPFWCLLDIVPIKNEKREVVLFLVSHKDITKERSSGGKKDGDDDSPDSPSKKSGSDASSDEDGEDKKDDPDMPQNYDYGRRRSRAVLYHISGQLNKQNKAKSKLHQLNRLASQMPEYKVQEVRKSRFIIVHYGIFKIGWDWLILLCTFYIAFMVPFNAAFKKFGRFRDFMYVDAAVEVLFALDIFLNFRTTFLNKSGQVVYESRTIIINYIKGWFLLDLLAAIPFDLLYAFSVETATMVHLLKVARLLRLARLLQKLERYNQYSFLVLALLLCMFALLAHWLACIWYAIGKAEMDENDGNWTVGWLYELSERLDMVIINKTNGPDMMTSYITALYFTCSSLTSVGFGNVSANTNAEKIFSVCAMLLGAIMHAVVFGNVTTIIQRMYARKAIFHSKTKDLKDFFRIHHIPKELKHRMRDYFQAMWSITNGIDFKEIVKDFPEDMRGEIGLHLHREILSLPIFQQAPAGCLKTVSLRTERFVCGPGEFIMHKGDTVNYLYYVCSGSMEVLKDDQVVAILGKGDIFGTDLDYDDPVSVSGCDVRSLAYCELLCIQVKGLVEALLLYPDYADTFVADLPNDLTCNVREGHEDHSDDESSSAAPVITLPSISEDEEENADNNNEASKEKLKGDDFDCDGDDDKGHTSLSPLLSREHSHICTGEWVTGRGRLPNGHIANTIRDETLGLSNVTPAMSSVPTTPTQQTLNLRAKLGPLSLSSLAMRRASSGMPRLIHKRGRDKMKTCRTLPTLNSVTSERSVEQVMVHTLQMELEGTRDTVIGLERRLDDLHDDLSSISRNVDSLLRLVSQSPCPSNMYLSSHSLQPSYNPSPSPNPNMYPTPSFYFSQSTDYDTRDSISLQSASSPAPDTWPGYSFQHRNEQFLSPFQAPRGGYCTPSPLASPRVNFSQSPVSGYFPSFARQGTLNINIASDRAATPDLGRETSGSINTLHSPGTNNLNRRSPLHIPQLATSQALATGNNSQLGGGKGPDGSMSSVLLRGRSSRPSNLSPLTPRRAKSLFVKPTRSFPESALAKNCDMEVSATMASSSLQVGQLPPDQGTASPFGLDPPSHGFQDDYFKVSQLEPCNAKSGQCEKANAVRRSYSELSSLSSHPKCDIDKTFEEHSRPQGYPIFKSSDPNISRDTTCNILTSQKANLLLSKETSSKLHSTSSSPVEVDGKTKINSAYNSGLSSKSTSPKSQQGKAEVSPTISHSQSSTSLKPIRPQSLSPSFRNATQPAHRESPTSHENIEFIDCEPFPEKVLVYHGRSYSPSLSQLSMFTATACRDVKPPRSASTSALSQNVANSVTRNALKDTGVIEGDNLIAPLSHAESFTDLQHCSQV